MFPHGNNTRPICQDLLVTGQQMNSFILLTVISRTSMNIYCARILLPLVSNSHAVYRALHCTNERSAFLPSQAEPIFKEKIFQDSSPNPALSGTKYTRNRLCFVAQISLVSVRCSRPTRTTQRLQLTVSFELDFCHSSDVVGGIKFLLGSLRPK